MIIDKRRYLELKLAVLRSGYAADVVWAEDLKPCPTPCAFLREYVWVLLNSGMKAQVATVIARRVYPALRDGTPIRDVFGHPGKAAAIEQGRHACVRWFAGWQAAEDKLTYLESLPWIGGITKYHLSKNLGDDVAKPDRHLVRIAGGVDAAHELCRRLSEQTGDRVATVDTVLWRACEQGWL